MVGTGARMVVLGDAAKTPIAPSPATPAMIVAGKRNRRCMRSPRRHRRARRPLACVQTRRPEGGGQATHSNRCVNSWRGFVAPVENGWEMEAPGAGIRGQ